MVQGKSLIAFREWAQEHEDLEDLVKDNKLLEVLDKPSTLIPEPGILNPEA